MNAQDKLHPTVKAYQVWADALKPVLTELLGPALRLGPCPAAHRRSRSIEMMALRTSSVAAFRLCSAWSSFLFAGTHAADLPHFRAGNRRATAPGSRQAFPHPRRRARQLLGRDGGAGRCHTARDGAAAPEHGADAGRVGTGGTERRGFRFQHSRTTGSTSPAGSISTWCCCGSEPGRTRSPSTRRPG